MGRIFATVIAIAWLSCQSFASCADKVTEEPHFQPAKAVAVSDVTIPFRIVASGTVVLEVTISEEGQVRNVQARRDIASETEEAVRSVKTWKFEPAKLNGRAATSSVTIAVTFNPWPPLCQNIPLPPLIPHDKARLQSSFHPPDVTHATFPTCPANAPSPGTAILEATINEAGKVERTKVLRDAPPFTTMSLQAIGDWRFTPATLNDSPVESKVVLVFCFRQLTWP